MKKIHQVFLKHSEGLITAAVLQNKTRKTKKQKNKNKKKWSSVVIIDQFRKLLIVLPVREGKRVHKKKQNRKSSLYLQRGA